MRRLRAALLAWAALLPLLVAAPAGADEGPGTLVAETARLRFVAAPGAEATARALALAGEEDRDWVSRDLGRDWDGVTEVRVAASRAAFDRMLPPDVSLPDWAGGVAFAAQNLVVIHAPPGSTSARHTLRHELSHVAVGRLTQGRVPRWFLEGLAQLREGNKWSTEGPSLVLAALSDGLFSFDALRGAFPARPSDVELAYAQSAHFVQWIANAHGDESLSEVLHQVVDGSSFEDAVLRVTGTRLRVLENEWRRELARWELLIHFFRSDELLWTAVTMLFLAASWQALRRKRRQFARLADEEAADDADLLAHAPAIWADGPPPVPRPVPAEDLWPQDPDLDELDDLAPKKPTLH